MTRPISAGHLVALASPSPVRTIGNVLWARLSLWPFGRTVLTIAEAQAKGVSGPGSFTVPAHPT